jgi:hypothetical protein
VNAGEHLRFSPTGPLSDTWRLAGNDVCSCIRNPRSASVSDRSRWLVASPSASVRTSGGTGEAGTSADKG